MAEKMELTKEEYDRLLKIASKTDLKKTVLGLELQEFKDRFGVTGTSGLRCPACSQYGESGGSLWGPQEGFDNRYTCRKCKLTYTITCLDRPISEVCKEIKDRKKDGNPK